MGNAAPRAQPQSVLDSASQYRTFLMDYTPRSMDMMFGSLIGDGKFLKSISCKCDEGHLVVKIYRKYDERESLTSAEVALRRLALAFSVEQQPNVIPYADFQLSNKYNVAFMVRQYFASNLYDRICSRPFLTMVEKKWIAFQILRALEQSHAKGICHGDIKQENVMVTSWNWVFLTDFAPFKPTYIPEDDPADYNYYFCAIDATRRGCSVAPERFYGKGSASMGAATGSTPGSVGLNSMKTPDAAVMLSKMADSEVTVEEVDKQILAMGMGSATMSGNPMQTPPSATSNGSAPSSYSRSRREGSLLESMDIFSAGCVIAELFLGVVVEKCLTLAYVLCASITDDCRSVLGSFLGIFGIATAFDEISTSPLSEEPSVRAMLCPSLHLRGIGDALITGGEDRQLRYWDIRNGKQSYTICGNGEAKSFYDNQAPPNDWWRMNPSSSSSAAAPPQRFGEMPAAPISTTAAVTKPEMAWSKLSPPLITVCQDSSFYSTPGGVASAAASGAGGVESAISMERRGLVPPSPAHTDCILDLTLVELGSSQNPSPMLVSSGRDALIKVWK
ncbi:VPS15 protein kinase [Phytophthora cinnamomi]|uniref:VPS15 protein kinase n=1 Tax=Phytophthora cinnamomi TaxID=4785 RepID=UPI003559C9F2|nr:VPS15 protein kinase [Phytophthora cinnamomi]